MVLIESPLALSISLYHTNTQKNTYLTLSQTSTSKLKLKEFAADDTFDENGRKFSKWVENTVGKGEIARYEQFLLFPRCFQKTCTADTLKPGLVWERDKQIYPHFRSEEIKKAVYMS